VARDKREPHFALAKRGRLRTRPISHLRISPYLANAISFSRAVPFHLRSPLLVGPSPSKRVPKSVASLWTFWTGIAGGLGGAAALSGAGTAVSLINSSNPDGENTRR